MQLEQQVCSLPLAQRLKELGVKQESLFVYVPEFAKDDTLTGYRIERNDGGWSDACIPAYSVAELGEMLPCEFHTDEATFHLVTSKEYTGWHIRYENHLDGQYVGIQEHTEADARAKMLIYLLENNLITV